MKDEFQSAIHHSAITIQHSNATLDHSRGLSIFANSGRITGSLRVLSAESKAATQHSALSTPMQDYLREYGLWALFFLTMIEGDVSLLFAGVMAHQGLFELKEAFVVGTAGGVASDLIGYLIGHIFRSRARTLKFYVRAKPRIERLLRRFGGFTLFVVKYTYGLRTAMSVFCGLAHFGFVRFAPLTLLACVAWVTLLVGAGYVFADSIQRIIGDLKHFEKGLLVAAVLLVIVFVIKHYRLGRRVIEE
jgi:membrane protein DedA with SNARE-associated domain